MKVLKAGDLSRVNPVILFKCGACSCKFVADADECKRFENPNECGYVYRCPTCKGYVRSNKHYQEKKV